MQPSVDKWPLYCHKVTFVASFLLIMQPFEDNLLHANTLKPTVERFVLWRAQTCTRRVVNILFNVHLLD